MSEKQSLRQHSKQARQAVDGWPEWKKRALGGGAPYSPGTDKLGLAKSPLPARGKKHASD